MLDGVGVDLQPVAPAVPVDDRFLVGGGDRQVAVVLVPDPLAEGFGDGRGDAEVLVGGAHADLDLVGAVAGDLGVPLRRVGPDAAVDGVEVVAAVLPDGAAPALRRKGNRAADGARDRGHAGGAQEGAPVEPTELGHLWTPLVLPRRSSSTAVRASPRSRCDLYVRPEAQHRPPGGRVNSAVREGGASPFRADGARRHAREGSGRPCDALHSRVSRIGRSSVMDPADSLAYRHLRRHAGHVRTAEPARAQPTTAAAPRMMSAAPRHSR